MESENPKQSSYWKHQNLIPGLTDDVAIECLIRVPYSSHSEMGFVCRAWRALVSCNFFYKERPLLCFSEQLLCLVQPLPSIDIDTEDACDGAGNKPSSDQARASQPSYGLSIYNASNKTWRRVFSGGEAFEVPMFCQCLVLPSSKKLVLVGGWDPKTLEPVADVYVFSFVTHSWARGASMAEGRSFFACVVVGKSKVYVAGGHDRQKNALKSAEVYDAEKDEWTRLPDMEHERDECHGMSWSGEDKFWVVSGYRTECQGRFRRDAECYDPATNCWSTVENVWPFVTLSPRCTAAVSGPKGREWQWFIGREQLQGTELEEEDGEWEVVRSVIRIPEGMGGSNLPCATSCNGDLLFLMGGSSNRPGQVSSSTSGESAARRCCDGEGAFTFGTDKKWRHVHTPAGYSGFPYSASYLQV